MICPYCKANCQPARACEDATEYVCSRCRSSFTVVDDDPEPRAFFPPDIDAAFGHADVAPPLNL